MIELRIESFFENDKELSTEAKSFWVDIVDIRQMANQMNPKIYYKHIQRVQDMTDSELVLSCRNNEDLFLNAVKMKIEIKKITNEIHDRKRVA